MKELKKKERERDMVKHLTKIHQENYIMFKTANQSINFNSNYSYNVANIKKILPEKMNPI